MIQRLNPELQRNLWLECTPLRLVAAPLLGALVLLLIIAGGGGWQSDVFETAHAILLIAVAFWGARVSADAVAGEIRDRTWDQQRISGLGPMAMTAGKVFGAPSYVWVIVALCLAAQALALLHYGDGWISGSETAFGFASGWGAMLAEIAGALFTFCTAFFLSLLALNGQDRARSFDVTLFQFAAVAAGVTLIAVVSANHYATDHIAVWWGLRLGALPAVTLSLLVFALWAFYGGYHQMRRAFAMRTNGLPWIAFLVFLGVFAAGWALELKGFAALYAVAAAGYAAVLLEPHRAPVYRHWGRTLAQGRASALLKAPSWVYAWIGAALLVGWILAYERYAVLEQLLEFGAEVDVERGASLIGSVALAGLFFMLRDFGICVWAGLRASDGRGLWASLVILGVLYLLLPNLLDLAAGGDASALFWPTGVTSLVSAVLQAAVTAWLCARELGAAASPDVKSLAKTAGSAT